MSNNGSQNYTSDEMMTIAAARMIRNGATLFVGIGLPSAAANLARQTHAPETVLIYESGTIGSKPTVLPLSIGDWMNWLRLRMPLFRSRKSSLIGCRAAVSTWASWARRKSTNTPILIPP